MRPHLQLLHHWGGIVEHFVSAKTSVYLAFRHRKCFYNAAHGNKLFILSFLLLIMRNKIIKTQIWSNETLYY